MPAPKDSAPDPPSIGTKDEIATLAKMTPQNLPNNTLVASLQQQYPKDARWRTFRNDPNYILVMNWMAQCRGYIRLALEPFDVDLFEIELFNLVSPPPVDDMALLSARARMALLAKVHGKKVASPAMFEPLFRVYFGLQTPLGGSDDEAEDLDALLPRFDDLYIDEKFAVLALLVAEVTLYSDFRDYTDKAHLAPDALRLPAMARTPPTGGRGRGHLAEDYVLLFDNTALYRRVVAAPELVIPKRRKLAPAEPELHYAPETFDVDSARYELVFKDIYELSAFVAELMVHRKQRTNKALLEVIRKPAFISHIYQYEFRKRKVLLSRRKEFEMAHLLATRKRSSRIEAKEKQRHEEEQERRARELELEDLKFATSRRSQRTQRQREEKLKMDYTAGLSRGERLNQRKEKFDDGSWLTAASSSPMPQLADAELASESPSASVAELSVDSGPKVTHLLTPPVEENFVRDSETVSAAQSEAGFIDEPSSTDSITQVAEATSNGQASEQVMTLHSTNGDGNTLGGSSA